MRSAVLEFMDTVRTVEHAIAAGRRGEDVPEELDVASLGVVTEEEWRAYWPVEPELEVDLAPEAQDGAETDVEPEAPENEPSRNGVSDLEDVGDPEVSDELEVPEKIVASDSDVR